MTGNAPTDSHVVFLPALCWNRQHSDFYAVTESISAKGIAVRSSVVPEVGTVLTCSIRYIGTLEARVCETDVNAFVLRLSVSRERAAEIARTMMALAREQDHPPEPGRMHRRIAPRRRDVLVTLQDGCVLPGRIINVSASGATVFLARPMEVGASITLGSTAARVVRRFQEGIGVVFSVPLDPARVDAGIRL